MHQNVVTLKMNEVITSTETEEESNNKNNSKIFKLITKERIKLLNKINFVWDVNMYIWNWNYQELIKFYKQYGHCFVPQHYKDNSFLGIWVVDQRKRHSKKYTTTTLNSSKKHDSSNTYRLSSEQITKLNAINFTWNAQEARWMERYYQLKKYSLENNGNIRVPTKCCKKLYDWTIWQRKYYNKGVMSEERVKLLNDISFNWGDRRM